MNTTQMQGGGVLLLPDNYLFVCLFVCLCVFAGILALGKSLPPPSPMALHKILNIARHSN